MSDSIPQLGGGEVLDEVTSAARHALSIARRRSPHLRRSFSGGRVRGQRLQHYAISRTRRVRSTTSDRTGASPDVHRQTDDRLGADLNRAAMLAQWAAAVAAAEAAQEIVADLATEDPSLEAAQIDADHAAIQADAWQERLLEEHGIDVDGLAAEPVTDLPDTDLTPGSLTEATATATAELTESDIEAVPADASIGDLLEQSGLGEASSPSPADAAADTSFAPSADLAPAVDLDTGYNPGD